MVSYQGEAIVLKKTFQVKWEMRRSTVEEGV